MQLFLEHKPSHHTQTFPPHTEHPEISFDLLMYSLRLHSKSILGLIQPPKIDSAYIYIPLCVHYLKKKFLCVDFKFNSQRKTLFPLT